MCDSVLIGAGVCSVESWQMGVGYIFGLQMKPAPSCHTRKQGYVKDTKGLFAVIKYFQKSVPASPLTRPGTGERGKRGSGDIPAFSPTPHAGHTTILCVAL